MYSFDKLVWTKRVVFCFFGFVFFEPSKRRSLTQGDSLGPFDDIYRWVFVEHVLENDTTNSADNSAIHTAVPEFHME